MTRRWLAQVRDPWGRLTTWERVDGRWRPEAKV